MRFGILIAVLMREKSYRSRAIPSLACVDISLLDSRRKSLQRPHEFHFRRSKSTQNGVSHARKPFEADSIEDRCKLGKTRAHKGKARPETHPPAAFFACH